MALCIYLKGAGLTDQVTLVLVMQYTAEMGWIRQMLF